MKTKQTDLANHIIKNIIQPIDPTGPFEHNGKDQDVKSTSGFTNKRFQIKRKSQTISLGRAKQFMYHLWLKGLKECSFSTLEFEFIQCFGTNEQRVLDKYLGRPKGIVRHGGSSVVRMNRQLGNVAQFNYVNTRVILSKRGLLETLGYLSQEVNGRYMLHHEKFGYSYEQTFISDLCVNPIEAEDKQQHFSETVEREERRRRSYRLHTQM